MIKGLLKEASNKYAYRVAVESDLCDADYVIEEAFFNEGDLDGYTLEALSIFLIQYVYIKNRMGINLYDNEGTKNYGLSKCMGNLLDTYVGLDDILYQYIGHSLETDAHSFESVKVFYNGAEQELIELTNIEISEYLFDFASNLEKDEYDSDEAFDDFICRLVSLSSYVKFNDALE